MGKVSDIPLLIPSPIVIQSACVCGEVLNKPLNITRCQSPNVLAAGGVVMNTDARRAALHGAESIPP